MGAVESSWARARSLTALVEAERDGNAIAADQLGLSPVQEEQMIGPLLDFCPVTLAEDSKLLKAAPGIGKAVLYQGRLFKTSSAAARDKLLADPDKYLDCSTLMSEPLHGCLPVPLHSSIPVEPQNLALHGHCPVTLSFDPTSAECVVPGSKDWQVRLGGNVYRMVNQLAWRTFLQQPWLYSGLQLPTKMPAERAEVDMKIMPARGYCEQMASNAIIAALHACVEARPKYPGLTVQESVTKFIGLHLQAFNEAQDEERAEKNKSRLDDFTGACQLSGFLNREEVECEGYEDKMKRFAQLREAPWKGFDLKP